LSGSSPRVPGELPDWRLGTHTRTSRQACKTGRGSGPTCWSTKAKRRQETAGHPGTAPLRSRSRLPREIGCPTARESTCWPCSWRPAWAAQNRCASSAPGFPTCDPEPETRHDFQACTTPHEKPPADGPTSSGLAHSAESGALWTRAHSAAIGLMMSVPREPLVSTPSARTQSHRLRTWRDGHSTDRLSASCRRFALVLQQVGPEAAGSINVNREI
jgi:hypothetical protein